MGTRFANDDSLMTQHRILLIEDDPDARQLFAQLLEQAGYGVQCAEDGEDALEAVGRCRPDLILLDLRLPDGDGAALAQKIATHDDCRSIPIIVITALSPLEAPEDRLRQIKNFRRCIYKPCRPRTFLEAVEDVFRQA